MFVENYFLIQTNAIKDFVPESTEHNRTIYHLIFMRTLWLIKGNT